MSWGESTKIQGVSKLKGKTSGMVSSYRDMKKRYDNMGPEMYGHRVVRVCIYWVHADTSWLSE
jgi:hypothetical protein